MRGRGNLTVLYSAVRGGNKEHVVKYLLENGAMSSLNTQNDDGHTALHLAVGQQSMESVEDLLAVNGLDLNIQDKAGCTPLFNAVLKGNQEMVRRLLDKGADPNIANKNGQIPLLLAVFMDNEAIARVLIEKGAKLDSQVDGLTPLHMAVIKRNQTLVLLLLEQADRQNIKQRLLNTKSKAGLTPLHIAFTQYDGSMIRLLLDHGADLKSVKENLNAKEKEEIDSLLRQINYQEAP